MNPMLDPDLIEFMDDDTLLAAFDMVCAVPDNDDRAAVLAELVRRDLRPVATPGMAAMADGARTDRCSIALRL